MALDAGFLGKPRRVGWFALTSEVHDYRVRFWDSRTRSESITWSSDAEHLALRDRFLDWVAQRSGEYAQFAAIARPSDRVESRTLWLGHLHNTIAAASLLIALISLPPAIWRAITSRRPTPGHCPHCGYNLAGLPTAQCPECGTNTSP